MRRGAVLLLAAATGLSACQAAPVATTPTPVHVAPVAEQPWVRTTDGATDTSMTALFVTLSNPSAADVTLTRAQCPVAGMTQIHEMVERDGKKVMQEAKDGAVVPAGKHLHLKPGGHHVMLMRLSKPLPIGDETACDLTFSDGTVLHVVAPVKKFTEEEDHYHPGDPGSPTSTP